MRGIFVVGIVGIWGCAELVGDRNKVKLRTRFEAHYTDGSNIQLNMNATERPIRITRITRNAIDEPRNAECVMSGWNMGGLSNVFGRESRILYLRTDNPHLERRFMHVRYWAFPNPIPITQLVMIDDKPVVSE